MIITEGCDRHIYYMNAISSKEFYFCPLPPPYMKGLWWDLNSLKLLVCSPWLVVWMMYTRNKMRFDKTGNDSHTVHKNWNISPNMIQTSPPTCAFCIKLHSSFCFCLGGFLRKGIWKNSSQPILGGCDGFLWKILIVSYTVKRQCTNQSIFWHVPGWRRLRIGSYISPEL